VWHVYYKLVTSVSRGLEKKCAKADSNYMQFSDAASDQHHREREIDLKQVV